MKGLSICSNASIISLNSIGLSEANSWIEINTEFNEDKKNISFIKFHNVDGYIYKRRWLPISYLEKLKYLYSRLTNLEFKKKYDQ